MKKIRPAHVIVCALLVSLGVGAYLFGPLLFSVWRAQLYEHRAGPPELQRLIERSDGPINQADYGTFPYESISLETGPCFGPCPIYKLTLHRDGRAHLITDHLLADRRKEYTARISPIDYARVTQLVFLARAAARQHRYAGDWTDDSEAIVRATARGVTWEVSDYGGVSPPEVWSLIHLLRTLREDIDWQAAPTAG